MVPILKFPEELNMSIMQYMRYEDVKAFLTAIKQDYIPYLLSWMEREIKTSEERRNDILSNMVQTETNTDIIKHFNGSFLMAHVVMLWNRSMTNLDIIKILVSEETKAKEQDVMKNILTRAIGTGATLEVVKFLCENVSPWMMKHAKKLATQHRRKDVTKWLREIQI